MNVRRALSVANELWNLGFVAYVPHLSSFWAFAFPDDRTYAHWLNYDFNIILRCDAVLRIPGDSKGADEEVAFAIEHKISVYYSIEGLRKGLNDRR